jgi:hypothetical protein
METYIVQIWSVGPSTAPGVDRPLRGLVRLVRSGRETRFGSWEELRGLLDEGSAAETSPSPPVTGRRSGP